MKSVYTIVLIAIMGAGLLMMGCGGSLSPTLDATDGTEAGITISWANCGDGPYDVTKDSNPNGTFSTDVGTTTSESISDTTADDSAAVFYKVSGCTNKGMDLIDGGHTSGWTNGTSLQACFTSLDDAHSCIQDKKNECFPDPSELLGETVTLNGSSSGSVDISFALEAGGDGIWAIASFDFAGITGECTNGLSMNGEEVAPVQVASDENAYDGWMNGLVNYSGSASCSGDTWIVYNLEVDNRLTDGGNYYVGNGTAVEFYLAGPDTIAPLATCSNATACSAVACPATP